MKKDVPNQSDAVLSPEEMEVLRYYYYIHNGIDTVHVAPIDTEWLAHVEALIPPKLLRWQELFEELITEVKEDFLMSVKKGIVDFVLQDPGLNDLGITQYDSPERREMKQICKEFTTRFLPTKLKILNNLHLINPCMAHVLDLWHKQYS